MAEKTTPVAAPAVDADKLTRDLEGAQFRVLELEHKLAEVEKQRDALDKAVDAARDYIIEVEKQRDEATGTAERLDEQLRRAHRVKLSPEIAPAISALVDLYRVAASGGGFIAAQSYLDAAKRLADPLVKAILEE